MEPKNRLPQRRATSYDVAALAGVSQSAVSRCFKPGASISAKTRDKVVKAASELGYQPNAIARGLITQRSHLAAVIVSANLYFYYPDILSQLTETFAARDMRVLLFNVNAPADTDAAIDELWRYQVDGVISASYLSRSQFALLEQRGIPTVLLNRFFSDVETNSVWCDPADAAQDLVDHLVTHGHDRFAMIEGPEDSQVNMIRKQSVEQALAKHGYSLCASAAGTYRYDSAAQAVDTLLNGRHGFTALLCANDMMAMGALDHLQRVRGVRVPGDLSVAGFDGIEAAQFASYELTTIRQPISKMTTCAVEVLLENVQHVAQAVQRLSFPGDLSLGRTTGPAPG